MGPLRCLPFLNHPSHYLVHVAELEGSCAFIPALTAHLVEALSESPSSTLAPRRPPIDDSDGVTVLARIPSNPCNLSESEAACPLFVCQWRQRHAPAVVRLAHESR